MFTIPLFSNHAPTSELFGGFDARLESINTNQEQSSALFVIATYRALPVTQYAGFVVGLSCGAIVLTWMYNRSGGSVLLVTVWHGVSTKCPALRPRPVSSPQ